MKTAVFSTKSYDRQFLREANREAGHELVFFESRLTEETLANVTAFEQGQPVLGIITAEMVRA